MLRVFISTHRYTHVQILKMVAHLLTISLAKYIFIISHSADFFDNFFLYL